MSIFERLKKLLKNKPVINETNLARIDTDLVFIPSFKKLTKEDQEKVLNYIKEININDLDSLVNYAKELSEEANFDTEILLRLYYKLIDENEVNEDNENIIYDKYKTIISINELNLCKNDLNKLRNEGILRVVSLEEVLKKELSRKLTFLGMFSKVEKNKRENDINSLKDAIERTKIVIKVIEQLISTVNNSVSNNTLKVKRENVFLSLTNEKDNKEILNELVKETKILIKRFLPLYEKELVLDIENVDSCLFNISIAKRLLDLYAYKHKNEAIGIINDINKVISINEHDKELIEQINLIEYKYKLFFPYVINNSEINDKMKELYKLKFQLLIENNQFNNPFENIKNSFELSCYYEFISIMLEDILKGNCALIVNDSNYPMFSIKKQKDLLNVINNIIKSNNDLSPKGILKNIELTSFIYALSTFYNIPYNERRSYVSHDESKYNCNVKVNETLIYSLLRLFSCYELYNNEKQIKYILPEWYYGVFPSIIHDFSRNPYRAVENWLYDFTNYYIDIMKNSDLCILIPDIRSFFRTPPHAKLKIDFEAKKIVLGTYIDFCDKRFSFDNLKEIDLSFMKQDYVKKIMKDNYYIGNSSLPNIIFDRITISYKFLEENCFDNKKYLDDLFYFLYKDGILSTHYKYLFVRGDNTWCISVESLISSNHIDRSKSFSENVKELIDKKEKEPNKYNGIIISLEAFQKLEKMLENNSTYKMSHFFLMANINEEKEENKKVLKL